jgi:group I intron endonuclease
MLHIYEHIRPDTNAVFYVGKGTEQRMHSKHRRNAYWNNIVRKAGGFTVREVCRHEDEELVFLAEQERIDQLKRLGVKLSNMTDGGEGPSGYRHTEEAKRKITEAQIGKKHWAYGKQVSEEERLRLSQIAKRKHTDEHRKKVSEAGKGRVNSPKTRALISKSKQGGKHHHAKTVEYNGKRFSCVNDLALYLNKPYGTVATWINKDAAKYGITVIGLTRLLKGV